MDAESWEAIQAPEVDKAGWGYIERMSAVQASKSNVSALNAVHSLPIATFIQRTGCTPLVIAFNPTKLAASHTWKANRHSFNEAMEWAHHFGDVWRKAWNQCLSANHWVLVDVQFFSYSCTREERFNQSDVRITPRVFQYGKLDTCSRFWPLKIRVVKSYINQLTRRGTCKKGIDQILPRCHGQARLISGYCDVEVDIMVLFADTALPRHTAVRCKNNATRQRLWSVSI